MAKQSGTRLDRFFGDSVGPTEFHPFLTLYACVHYSLPSPTNKHIRVHVTRHLFIADRRCVTRKTRRAISYVSAINDVDETKPVLLAPFDKIVRFSQRAEESEVVDRGRPDNCELVGATCISNGRISEIFGLSSPLSFFLR